MTAPVVGSVAVELVAEARGLAKSIRNEIKNAFKDLDLKAQLRDALTRGGRLKVPVEPDFDTGSIPEKVRKTRTPRVPVVVDPLFDAFRQDLRRQAAALAKQVHVDLPVDGDTAGLRAELGTQLAEIGRQLKAKIPVEPEGRAKLQADLQEQLAAVSERLKAHVKVEPEPGAETVLKEKIERTRPTVKVKVEPDRGAAGGVTRLLKDITPNTLGIGAVTSAVQGLVSGLGSLVSGAAPAGSALSSIGSAAGPIGAVAAAVVGVSVALGGLAVAATIAGPALLAAAGAAAAIPAALSGLGAVVGTLGLGLKGISEAFKPTAGGGGGGGSIAGQARQVAAASRQVEAARRGIAAANRGVENAERSYTQAVETLIKAQARAKAAEDAVAKARRDAVDDIDDLNRALRSSRLSEEEAAQAVQDALRELESAKLTGDIPSITRARLAYERAQITLEDTRDASEDLQKQADETAKSGVDGTDRVKQALAGQASAYDDVKRAQEGVRDAQNGLISAQDSLTSATDGLKSAQEALAAAQTKTAGGSAAAAAKMIPLAKSARAFVDAVKAIKPAFEDLRLDVQERLFAGLDKTVTSMWKAWKDQLHATLGSFADTINGFLRNLGASVSTPAFIKGIADGAEGVRLALANIGSAITSSLVPAFGTLSGAAKPFLETVGGVIADLIRDFGTWIQQARDSGELKDFFTQASAAFKSISTTGKLVVQIVGELFSIITGADPATGDTALDSFNNGLKKVRDWLADPQNQQRLHDFVTDLKDGLVKFGQAADKVNTFLATVGGDDKGESAGTAIGRALVSGIIAGIGQALAERAKDFRNYLGPVGVMMKLINGLLGIESPSTVMMEVGRQLIAGLIAGIGQSIGLLRTGATNIRNTVVNTLSNAGSWLYQHGRAAISGLGSGISSMFTNLRVWAGNARVYVQNALVNAGSWLYQHGRAVIDGLIRGVQSMFATLGSFLGGVGRFIQDHKGPLDKDRRLLVPAGQAILGGLITGIAGRKAALADELADVTRLVADTSLPSLGITDAALAAQLQASTSSTLLAQWKPGTTGDQLLDALRRLIEFSHNGDPVAALGS